jgi:hypothetical protein
MVEQVHYYCNCSRDIYEQSRQQQIQLAQLMQQFLNNSRMKRFEVPPQSDNVSSQASSSTSPAPWNDIELLALHFLVYHNKIKLYSNTNSTNSTNSNNNNNHHHSPIDNKNLKLSKIQQEELKKLWFEHYYFPLYHHTMTNTSTANPSSSSTGVAATSVVVGGTTITVIPPSPTVTAANTITTPLYLNQFTGI